MDAKPGLDVSNLGLVRAMAGSAAGAARPLPTFASAAPYVVSSAATDQGAALAHPSTPPAEEWQANWAATLPQLEEASRSMPPPRDVSIMRSSQLDAARLDDELAALLREQLLRASAWLFRPAAVARLQPELTLLLEFLIFRFSVWEGRPLPGMALMNLRYRNEAAAQPPAGSHASGSGTGSRSTSSGSGGGGSSRSGGSSSNSSFVGGGHSGVEGPGLSMAQRTLYCLGAVLLRYAWARLGHHAASQHWGDASAAGGAWRRRCWGLMRRAESAHRLASLANFLDFLRTGRYRGVLERLLQARLVYQQPSAARAISFDYLNRQLVWSELSELLLFLLPLVNAKAIKRALRSCLPRLPILAAAGGAAAGGAGGGGGSGGAAGGGGEDADQPCGICNAGDILEPYTAVPCGHRFCYYCLRSHCLADPQYSCPLCLRRVDALQRAVLPLQQDSGSTRDGAGSGGGGAQGGSGDAGSSGADCGRPSGQVGVRRCV